MKAFRYVALSSEGRRVTGLGYAAARENLRDELIETRLHPIAIRPAWLHASTRLSLSGAEAARLARDMAQLLTSGLALNQALALIQSRETARAASAARELRRRLADGQPLSQAFSAIDGQPARFLQALARAGEASGKQAEVLAAGARALAETEALRRRLMTLSIYPAFVMSVAFGSIGVYAFAVLPALEPAFEGLGDAVPPATRTVLIFGAGVRAAFPIAMILAGLGVVALAASARFRRAAKDLAARAALRLRRSPLRDLIFAGVGSRLAVMLRAGVPLAAAWRLARDPVSIPSLSRRLAEQDNRLMEGARLSEALMASGAVPPDLIHYASIGEQSGHLGKTLEDGAAALAERAKDAIERWLSIATPLVIVVIGLLVGLITMMVFQGLLAVSDAVST